MAERERRNGTVLEVRTKVLDTGMAVRTYTDVTDQERTAQVLAETMLIVERHRAGWAQAHIAKAMGISRKCVKTWVDRYAAEGEAGHEADPDQQRVDPDPARKGDADTGDESFVGEALHSVSPATNRTAPSATSTAGPA